ncbi:MAG: ribosome biogenesis GTPase Der [Thiohalospira sp.]
MKPILALVGRPNVGKSTLFNRLTRSRDALVADFPGLTRDRQYGEARVGDRDLVLVDTGGLGAASDDVEAGMEEQAWQAVDEADGVLFLVDGRDGLSSGDEAVAAGLRERGVPVTLVVNKGEGLPKEATAAEFHALGLGEPRVISAAHGQGVVSAVEAALPPAPEPEEEAEEAPDPGIPVAVVGRPNVGKSTLVNRLLGEERVLVHDGAGTTRDAVRVPFERDGERWTLIDTAGVRRRSKVHQTVEKFSIVKTLQAVDAAGVVILVMDAREGITDQDAHLIGHVIDAGRALVLAINKWDHLPAEQKEKVRRDIDRRLPFVDFARRRFVSALHGTGVGKLLDDARRAWASADRDLPTSDLNRLLEDAVAAHQPPMVRGRRIKLRYAHQAGTHPPTIVVHGNQAAKAPEAYRRYLMNTFRKHFQLEGTPLRLELRTGDNPYAGKKNPLTKSQEDKRRRARRRGRKRYG